MVFWVVLLCTVKFNCRRHGSLPDAAQFDAGWESEAKYTSSHLLERSPFRLLVQPPSPLCEVHCPRPGAEELPSPVSTEYSTGLLEPRRDSKRETIGKRSTVGRRRRQGQTEARYDVGGAAKRRKPEKLRRWHPYTTTNAQACAKGNDSGAR